jgi:hypothetical protein
MRDMEGCQEKPFLSGSGMHAPSTTHKPNQLNVITMNAETTPNPEANLNAETVFHPETTHRLGKIGRLPAAIRQQLNLRLEDNEPGLEVLDWLNALPEVKRVLKKLFDGRPITEQNLSAWRNGGFQDWQRHQQCRVRARDFLEEARELDEEVAGEGDGGGSLLDRVSDRMALALLELFREAQVGEPGPERTRTMLAIAREVARLRRGDHDRQQAEVAEQRWQHERDLTLREVREREEEKQKEEVKALCKQATELRAEFFHGLAYQDANPERGVWIMEFFDDHQELLSEHGVPKLPEGEELKRELRIEFQKPEYDWFLYNREQYEARKKKAAAKKSKPVQAAPGKSKADDSAARDGNAQPA